MTGLVLREDQEKARSDLRAALLTSTAVLLFAPTGFGKTVLAAKLIELIHAKGKRVIFAVHRVDLITQTAKTFERVGLPFSYIAAGYPFNPHARIFVASIATLQNRLGKIPADYVMVDEAHLSAAAGWAKVAKHYKEAGARLIGFTGSPERLDGKPLSDVWDTLVMGPSVRWLIDNGHLSKYRAFAPAALDLTAIHTRGGEYVHSEIDDLMSGKAVLAGAIRHWKAFARGKRTIAFAPSILRSEQLAAEFRDAGIVAVALDANTPQADRRAAFLGFADRQIDVIVNCQLFCEGFDLAAQVDRDVTVEAVLDYSPTQSLARHLQKMGRGLRRKPEPAVLLDLVGAFKRLGLPDEDHQWSLDGRLKEEKREEVVICPDCYAAHDPGPRCPECGHAYPLKKREALGSRSIGEVEGDLEEIDIEAVRAARVKEERAAKTLPDLVNLGTARGYKDPQKWAAMLFTRRAEAARRYRQGRFGD